MTETEELKTYKSLYRIACDRINELEARIIELQEQRDKALQILLDIKGGLSALHMQMDQIRKQSKGGG